MSEQLEPTPPPPPLYVRGRRREGASRWGYDPKAPVLVPARRVQFKGPPPEYIDRAFGFLTSDDTFAHRRRELVGLRKRSKRVDGRTVIYTPGLTADVPESQIAELRRPRGDHRARLQAWLAGLVQFARAVDPKHDLVGVWSSYVDPKGQKRTHFVRPYSRHELAALTGVPVKQVDVMIREAKNAGYIARRQRRRKTLDGRGRVIAYRPDRATLLLTEQFYSACGAAVWRARSKHLGLFKRPPDEPAGPTPPPAAEPEPWTPPEARGWGPRRDEDPPDPTS